MQHSFLLLFVHLLLCTMLLSVCPEVDRIPQMDTWYYILLLLHGQLNFSTAFTSKEEQTSHGCWLATHPYYHDNKKVSNQA